MPMRFFNVIIVIPGKYGMATDWKERDACGNAEMCHSVWSETECRSAVVGGGTDCVPCLDGNSAESGWKEQWRTDWRCRTRAEQFGVGGGARGA